MSQNLPSPPPTDLDLLLASTVRALRVWGAHDRASAERVAPQMALWATLPAGVRTAALAEFGPAPAKVTEYRGPQHLANADFSPAFLIEWLGEAVVLASHKNPGDANLADAAATYRAYRAHEAEALAALQRRRAEREAEQGWRDEATGLTSGGYPPVLAANDAEAAPEYLIWSHHHKAWWGPNGCGYRSHVADAGRYALADTAQWLTRGCGCCPVPEVVVKAPGPALLAKPRLLNRYMKVRIRRATAERIESGAVNKYAQKVIDANGGAS